MRVEGVEFSEPPDLLAALKELLQQIPTGRISTFGTLARSLGDVRAAAWVASALKQARIRSEYPWYRIVKAKGELAGSTLVEQALQTELLQREGLSCERERVSTSDNLFEPVLAEPPLARLQTEQQAAEERVRIEQTFQSVCTVAGLDLAFPKPRTARAAYVELEWATGKLLWQQAGEFPCHFPYIPGYLSYRELPAYLALLQQVQQQRPLADLLMVDGSGRLHPRRLGIACHLGVLLDWPTIGVSKKLLAGKREPSGSTAATPVFLPEQELAGYELRQPAFPKPLYVSPGHRCNVSQARQLVEQCWQNHPLPEPTFLADRLSRNRLLPAE